MDINTTSLNVDNWENNEYLVIVNEGSVVSMPVQEPNSQVEETITFSEKHISITKDSLTSKNEDDQCFTLTDQHASHPQPAPNKEHMFSENLNTSASMSDDISNIPLPPLSDVAGGANIGDGIDILAEASLGLLSENIFNKESVNQIKDIVASTIANFAPTSDNYARSEMISSSRDLDNTQFSEITTHTSVTPPYETSSTTIIDFPPIENYASSEMETPITEPDNTFEIIAQRSEPVASQYENINDVETMESENRISEELVIPVTLAEVNRMLNDNVLVEIPLPEETDVGSGHKTTKLLTSFQEGRILDNNSKVICDESGQMGDSDEINIELDAQPNNALFESPVSTNQLAVEASTEHCYSNIGPPEPASLDQTIVFNTSTPLPAISGLMSVRPAQNTIIAKPHPVIDLQTSGDALSVSLADPVAAIRNRSASKGIEDLVSPLQTSGAKQSLTQSVATSVAELQQSSSSQESTILAFPMKIVADSLSMTRSKGESTQDSGRTMPKIRPGVKVASRNLSSQIVSSDEIAKELYAQALKKTPVRDLPQGGDLFYSRNLTKRLAQRIIPSTSTSIIETKLKQTQPVIALSQIVPTMSQGTESNPDRDLLAILEGDDEDWVNDRPPPQLIEAVTSPITARDTPPKLDPPIESNAEPPIEKKLDPVLERELALKQLNSLDSQGRNKKESQSKTRRKSKIQVKVDFDEMIIEEDNFPVEVDLKSKPAAKRPGRKRKGDSEPIPPGKNLKEPRQKHQIALQNNGERDGDDTKDAGSSDGKKRKIVQLSELKSPKNTKKSTELTNGKLKLEKSEKSNGGQAQKVVQTANSKRSPARNNDEKKEGSIGKKLKLPENVVDKSKSAKKAKAQEETVPSGEELVGPLSRNMPPPPRTYSSRIKRSPVFPDFIVGLPSTSKAKAVSSVPSTSKSKIIPIVPNDGSSNKKEQKTVAVIATVKSPSKVGRTRLSPKKSPVVKTVTASSKKKARVTDSGKIIKKSSAKKLSEVDRLLMDEGAINMLYAVEQDEENRRSGTLADSGSKKRVLKTTRRSQKDLVMKTRLVKNAVLRLTNSPESSQSTVYLRGKRTGPPLLKKPQSVHERKVSRDSSDSHRSPPPLTPFGLPSPTQVFTYPPRLHLPAEASRIIRRHSSSSNFSSRSTSPNPSRRLSVEASPLSNAAEKVSDTATTSAHKHTRKRGVPIFIKKQETTQTYKGKKKKISSSSQVTDVLSNSQLVSEESEDNQKSVSGVLKKSAPGIKTKLKAQLSKNFQKVTKGKVSTPAEKKGKRTSSVEKSRFKDEEKEGDGPNLTSCLADAVTAFITDDEQPESPATPNSVNQGRLSDSKKGSPLSPNATSYNNLIKTLETNSQKRQDGEDSGKERSSARQSVGSFHYKELSLRRYDTMVQVILTPSTTKMKNALSLQVLRELRDVLNQLRKDDTCRAVLVTSTGSSFCQGLDFHSLINDKPERRKSAAQELAHAVTQFMTSLAHFNKLIIAGVHGDAVGLGVTMLPFFDMVFASDKATFYTPYARLGQIPEGAAVITLPHMLGNAVTSELLFGCRKLTASEALHYGLVTRILWPDRFQEELLPIIRSLANQSAQSMEATKALLRHSLRSKLDSALESESHLLVQHWTSSECQNNFKRFLDDEDVGPQRQKVDA